jgi:hypothetical protein
MHPVARNLVWLTLVAALAGCGSTIDLTLREPPGARMFYQETEYVFRPGATPTVVRLSQFAEAGAEADEARPIRFLFPHPDDPKRWVHAEGILYVYEVTLSDAAVLMTNDLSVTADQIRRLADGGEVILKGFDPNGQTLYRMDLRRAKKAAAGKG